MEPLLAVGCAEQRIQAAISGVGKPRPPPPVSLINLSGRRLPGLQQSSYNCTRDPSVPQNLVLNCHAVKNGNCKAECNIGLWDRRSGHSPPCSQSRRTMPLCAKLVRQTLLAFSPPRCCVTDVEADELVERHLLGINGSMVSPGHPPLLTVDPLSWRQTYQVSHRIWTLEDPYPACSNAEKWH